MSNTQLPANNDAAFERLTEAVNQVVRCSSPWGDKLKLAFTAYASSRREAKPEYPVGSVVFVPDGETRQPQNGDYIMRNSGPELMRLAPGVAVKGIMQCYRRIDINPPAPAPEKTAPIETTCAHENHLCVRLDRIIDLLEKAKS